VDRSNKTKKLQKELEESEKADREKYIKYLYATPARDLSTQGKKDLLGALHLDFHSED